MFRKVMTNMGFGALFHISLPCTLQQYEACYLRVNMQRFSKIFHFQQRVLEYVKTNAALLDAKKGQITNLYSVFNR